VKELDPNSTILLDNVTCPYCGRPFDGKVVVRDKEHVVGRNFVPRGKLDGGWSLILRACRRCNGHKADLENDLSAISMQPDAAGRYPESDPTLISQAVRKGAKSVSRRTGKPVNASQEKLSLNLSYAPGIEFDFQFTSAPQADSQRVYELARLQLMGFFYCLTFDGNTRKGSFWRGGFFPIFDTVRSDWGNLVMRGFMDTVVTWRPRLLGIGADGFFKIAIREHPMSACWSWALEWNKNYRIIGFFGDQQTAKTIANGFPRLKLQSIAEGRDSFMRYYLETPLSDEEDKLFSCENTIADR